MTSKTRLQKATDEFREVFAPSWAFVLFLVIVVGGTAILLFAH